MVRAYRRAKIVIIAYLGSKRHRLMKRAFAQHAGAIHRELFRSETGDASGGDGGNDAAVNRPDGPLYQRRKSSVVMGAGALPQRKCPSSALNGAVALRRR